MKDKEMRVNGKRRIRVFMLPNMHMCLVNFDLTLDVFV